MAMGKLKRIEITGFRSIKRLDLELGDLNILIGANGAGKSNFVSFFKLLNEMIAGRLQLFIATSGAGHSILHFGPKVTPVLEGSLEFQASEGTGWYNMRLSYAADDALVFADERLRFRQTGGTDAEIIELGAGQKETRDTRGGRRSADRGPDTAPLLHGSVASITSTTRRARRRCDERIISTITTG